VKAGTHKELMRSWFSRGAMSSWSNNNGAEILWIHHSADPKKDNAWAEDFSKTLPGGRKGGAWRSEFDGEFDAHAGGRVFPDFSIQSHVIPPFDIPEEWPKWRSIDPGLEHALACGWYTLNPYDKMLIKFDEHVQAGWPEVAKHASVIRAKTGKLEIKFTVMDPSAFAKTLAGGGRSVADLFLEEGILVSPAYRNLKTDQIAALADLIMLRAGEPRFKVTSNCVVSIQQLLKYRWMQQLHDDKESPQKPVKIDDDAVDCDLYMALNIDPKRMSEDYRQRNPNEKWYATKEVRRIRTDLPKSLLVPRNWEDEEP